MLDKDWDGFVEILYALSPIIALLGLFAFVVAYLVSADPRARGAEG